MRVVVGGLVGRLFVVKSLEERGDKYFFYTSKPANVKESFRQSSVFTRLKETLFASLAQSALSKTSSGYFSLDRRLYLGMDLIKMDFNVPFGAFIVFMTAIIAISFDTNHFKLRLLALVALLVFCTQFSHVSHEFTHSELWNASITAMIWIYCIKIFDDVGLTQITFAHFRYPSPFAGSNIPGADQDRRLGLPEGNLHWAFFEIMFNFRGIGTRWTITQMQAVTDHAGTSPTRGTYLQWAAAAAFSSYSMVELVGRFIIPLRKEMVPFVSADKERFFSRLSSITGEELEFRCTFLIIFWLAIGWASRSAYFTLAFIHVGLGIHSGTAWPQVFGEWTKTYSLRTFWG